MFGIAFSPAVVDDEDEEAVGCGGSAAIMGCL